MIQQPSIMILRDELIYQFDSLHSRLLPISVRPIISLISLLIIYEEWSTFLLSENYEKHILKFVFGLFHFFS